MSVFKSAATLVTAGALLAGAASAQLVGDDYDYEIDGMAFRGYVAYNEALPETRGTVLIIHDWDGVNDYEKRRADMLAAQGYTAFAIDVYGRDRQPTSFQENQQRSGEMYANRDVFRTRLMGALDQVGSIPGGTDDVVVMGYCFGGAAVLEMARAGAEVDGFVSFHGGLDLPEGQDYSGVTAPVLLLHGSADPVSGMADLAALLDHLQEAGVTHNAQVFGGARHSFTVYGSNDYDLHADQGSWQALLGFLNEQL
jgi:dienelactone hydrolase